MIVKEVLNDDSYDSYLDYVSDRHFNDYRYSIDTTKLESLGWNKKMDFKEGLKQTIQWYMKAYDEKYWD